MRKRTKRILAFMLAMVLFATSFVNENLITAFAAPSDQTEYGSVSVQFGSTPVSDISNLEGMVTGHDLDLKLKVVSNDGEQTKNNVTLGNNSMNNIVYDSTYTYTYTLTSENYDLVLAGGDGTTYSQKATGFTFDENKQFTLVIEKVIPKYTFTMSPETTDPLTPGSSTEFSVNIVPEAWNDQIVTWSVLRNSEYVSITTDNNKCTVTVNDSLGSDDLEITLNAFAPNRQQMNKSIKLGKTPVALSVGSQTGNWDAIQITAATNPALSGAELKLVVPSAVEGEQGTEYTATTNEEGKAVFTVALTAAGTLNYHVEYAGNNTYKSAATASRSYTPTKKTPDLKFDPDDNVNIVCGTEVKIGTVSSGVADDQKQSFSSEAITEGKQNGTVRIDENGYVYYTPSVSGTAAITITRVEDTNYNVGTVSATVTVAKRIVTIASVTVKEKTYNGTADDIEVSVTLANTINKEKITLETNGKVEDANAADKEKEVTARVDLDKNQFEKYAFAGDAQSIEVKTADGKKPTVLIKKAPIKVTVDDNEKEWQADDTVNSLEEKITFSYEGFLGEDEPVDEEKLKEYIKYTTPADGIIGIAKEDVIGIELPEGEDGSSYVGSNYYIKEVIKGSLTLLPESISSYSDYTKYIAIDNNQSLDTHVYQSDANKKVYYAGNDVVAKFKLIDVYSEIWSVEDENLTDIGLIPSDGNIYLTDTAEKSADGNSTNKKKTKEFSIDFEKDETNPIVKISFENHAIGLESLLETITFGLFRSRNAHNVVIDVSDEQSGVAKWTVYKVTDISDDASWDDVKARIEQVDTSSEKLEIIKETFGTIEPINPTGVSWSETISSDDTYVYYVEATDNVGNSTFMGSNGIIIDGTNLNDIKVVAKKADDSTTVTFEDEKVRYFNEDVELYVEINDNKENNCIYTGVNTADVSVKVNGENAISYGKIQMDGSTVTENSFSLISNVAGSKTLKKIHAASVDKRIVVSTDKGVSNAYSFTFSAEDFAGNKPSDKKVNFVIDKAAPIITDATIETEKAEEALDGYYNKDVRIHVAIQERYLDMSDVVISGTCNGKEYTYTLDEIRNKDAEGTMGLTVEGISNTPFTDGTDDKKEESFVLVFSRAIETKYDLNITVKDKSGNTAEKSLGVFYIDTVAPIQEFSVIATVAGDNPEEEITEVIDLVKDEETINYLGEKYKSYKAVLTVDEQYFANNDIVNNNYVITTEDAKATAVEGAIPEYNAKSFENWTTDEKDSNKHTYTLIFDTDANYTFSYKMYDNAGNESVWKENANTNPVKVTLDRVRPTGKVAVGEFVEKSGTAESGWVKIAKTWDKFVEVITFGLFGKDTVKTDLTANDNTSGVETIQYIVSETQLSYENMSDSNIPWKDYEESFEIEADKEAIVYEKVVDKAGNTEYYSSDGFIVDATAPAISSVIITKRNDAAEVAHYYDDVEIVVAIQEACLDKDDVIVKTVLDGSDQSVNCTLTELIDGTSEKVQSLGISVEKVTGFDSDTYPGPDTKIIQLKYSNASEARYDVIIEATDKSMNVGTDVINTFFIDKEVPVITTAMDPSEATDGYYNENVEIPVTITERYLTEEKVVVKTRIDDEEKTIDCTLAELIEWSKESGLALSETASLSVKEVMPFEDSDVDPAEKKFTLVYALDDKMESKVDVTIEATDKSANHSDKTETFYIDKKAPEISKVEIKTERSENSVEGFYNTEHVDVDVVVKTRYPDLAQIVIKTSINDAQETVDCTLAELIQLSDEGKEYELSENSKLSVKDVSSFEDSNTGSPERSFTLIYSQKDKTEGKYNVTIDITDKSGNHSDAMVDTFYMDRKAPEQSFSIIAVKKGTTGETENISLITDGSTINYLNEAYTSFYAVLTVDEQYFAHDGKVNNDYYITAKDAVGKIVKNAIPTVDFSNIDVWSYEESSYIHTCSLTFDTDANYTFGYTMYDNAGNVSIWKSQEDVPTDRNIFVTMDQIRPEAEVSLTESYLKNYIKGEETNIWKKFVEMVTFKLFGRDKIEVKVKSSDVTSGIKTTEYFVSSEAISYDEISNAEIVWKDYEKPIKINANQKAVVYVKAVDKAGNIEYFSSDGMIVDNRQPNAPIITVKPSAPAWGKGIYSATDNPRFDFEVIEPTAEDGSRSGLKSVTYTITNGTTNEVTTETFTFEKGEHLEKFSQNDVTIDPNKFYSNDVKIQVTAEDWSGNSSKSNVVELAIDSKNPVVKFSFDTSDAQNQKYYKNNKTLIITVDERNFDKSYIPHVTSTTGGGYSWSGWSVNGETATGTVSFFGDSDYTVTYDCYDLAGNKSNTANLEGFTIDKINPVINVSYDNNSAQNGNYYKAARTATITITERNFRASDVKVTTTASNGAAPSVRGWSSSGDRHTATVYFGSDADYTFDVSYIDLAGNSAADYQQDKFTVDLTNPVIEITGVEDKSANKGTVAPTIKINDTNFDPNGMTVTLVGAKKGNVNVSSISSRSITGTGQVILFKNFADDMDDLYTLTVKSMDKAGNETVQSIQFSVNRNGSAYEFSKETKELLEKKYTNKAIDIVVKETNVDTLEFIELSYSKDGQIIKLSEGKDYKVEISGSEAQWKQYTYTIFASCFAEEGKYNINISSVDRAENESNNKVQSAALEFTIDQTAPTIAVSNLDNYGRYNEETHEFTLDVKDNTVLSKVELYLDGKLFRTYEGDELNIENGKLYITVDSKDKFQTIKLIAYDEAGNQTEPMEYSVLVTANGWVQFVANKPVFYGTIAALVAIAGIIIVVILKKKKNDEEKVA